MSEKKELTDEEIKEQSAAELPDREEMSVLGTQFLGPPVPATDPHFLGPPVSGGEGGGGTPTVLGPGGAPTPSA